MATIKIIVRSEKGKPRTNSKGETAVFVQYGHNEKSILFATQVRVRPDELKYQGKNLDQREPVKKSVHGYTTKNSNIRKIANEIDQIKDRLLNQDIDPTVEAVRTEYESRHKKAEPIDFFSLYDGFITDTSKLKSTETVKHYRMVRKSLLAFQEYDGKKITLESIDLNFYDRYMNYLLSKDLTSGTTGSHIKNFKTFLNYLINRGFQINVALSQFKVLKSTPVFISLSQEELEQLYRYDLSHDKQLEIVRDLFVLQSSIGIRWSDLRRLGREHIQNGIIRMKQQKTRKDLCIPLTPRALEILNKYNCHLPKVADQVQNRLIKNACRIAGIKRPIEIVTYKGGQQLFETVQLWQVISSHAAVRTFCSHAIELGISLTALSGIVGKSIPVLGKHYLGTSESALKNEVAKAFSK